MLALTAVLAVICMAGCFRLAVVARRPGERLFWRSLMAATLVTLALEVLRRVCGE